MTLVNRLCERIITGPAAEYAADVREALTERPADAVLASGPVALVGAESMGVPAVALCANFYSRPAPGIPPFGSGLAPARGPFGRARDRAVNVVAATLWNRNPPPLNAARTALELEPLRDVWEQWDRAARVLVLTSPACDLPAQLPANVRYVGPVLDDPGVDRALPHARGRRAARRGGPLAAGVPALCLPMGRDQGDNVVRAARHGAVVGLKPSARPERIAAAVRRLLDDPSYRENARALGTRIRGDASGTALVDEIEGLPCSGAPGRRLASCPPGALRPRNSA